MMLKNTAGALSVTCCNRIASKLWRRREHYADLFARLEELCPEKLWASEFTASTSALIDRYRDVVE